MNRVRLPPFLALRSASNCASHFLTGPQSEQSGQGFLSFYFEADLKGDLIMMLKGDLSALIKLLADRAINMLRENTDYARKGDAVPA